MARKQVRLLNITAATLALTAALAAVQTRITPPRNRYTPAQDVQIGREAAQEIEQQLPLLRDTDVDAFVDRIGNRLVQVTPAELRHPEFRYSFSVTDLRDINAFALPGGPMYVNRGMIEAAKGEGEVAGVIAHELSHVVLRHGTAGATKQQPFQIGAIAGAIAGAIVGGRTGQVISQGTQFGLGTYFLKYSREYEKQADLLGVQLMARAGYDPLEMAHIFQTIEKQGGSGVPQFLSDHPNPGNRQTYIAQEASQLRIQGQAGDSREFARVQQELRGLPRAPTTEEATRGGRNAPTRTGTPERDTSGIGTRVTPPSTRFRTYTEGDVVRISVPDNWRELTSESSATFVPEGAYGQVQGRNVFTHGVQLGVLRDETHTLREATQEFIDSLREANPSLRASGQLESTTLSGRNGLVAELTNTSEATRREETVTVFTTQLRNGSLFYLITVAPSEEHPSYESAFRRVVQSIRLMDSEARGR